MEDKKVLEFINKHHEESYKEFVKKERKKDIISTISIIIGILAVLSLVLVFGSVIHQETEKSVKKCLKSGHNYTYCLKDVQ